MSFKDRLRERREDLNMSRSELAKKLGVTVSAIGNYENGVSSPKEEILYKIFDVLAVEPNYLWQDEMKNTSVTFEVSYPEREHIKKYRALDGHGKKMVDFVLSTEHERVSTETAPEPQIPTTKIIPLYLSPAAAGYTSPVMGEDYEDYEVPASSEADYAVRIDGDSMEPYIKDKSVVLVKKTVDLKIGDVGIFSVDNDMYCKQYCQDHLGNVYLFSLNRKRKDADITVWHNSGQTLWCFGKVLMKKRVPLPTGRDI